MRLEEFLSTLTNAELENLDIQFKEKDELDIAKEVHDNLRNTIEKEYNSKIISTQSFNYHPERNYFHTIFKLRNNKIIDSLMIVNPQKFGLAVNIKHREILL